MRPAGRAWAVLAAGVLVYEIAAAEDELLSSAADRAMLTHPWITRTAVAAVGIHLCNAVPEQLDPLHWLFGMKRLLRRATPG